MPFAHVLSDFFHAKICVNAVSLVLHGYKKGDFMLFPRWLLPPTWFLFLLLLVAFELIADVLAKQFGVTGKFVFAVLSTLGYVVANTAWLISLRTGGELGRGAVIFSVLSGVGAVLIGLLVYQERVSSYQFIGLILGVAAIVFLSM